MTDVETRTPQKTPKKRKSVEGKQESPKKVKLENGKTPQKFQTPKQQKNQNKSAPNSIQKSNKKQKQNSESESPKKVKPFAGTAEIQSPKPVKATKAGKDSDKKSGEKKPKIERKPRRKLMSMIKDKLKSDDSVAKTEVIKNLETKLQAIQSRPNLTKTAIRKIKLLKRLKNIAEGKTPIAQGDKPKSDLSVSAKRRDRKKRAALKSVEGQSGLKAPASKSKKGQQVKVKNQKNTTKQDVKIEKSEEASDDEESDDEEESESGEEQEGEESGEEEDSGDEVEGSDDDEEEGSDDDEEGSDDDEEGSDDDDDEDEEVSPPQPPVKNQSKPLTSRQAPIPKTKGKNKFQESEAEEDFKIPREVQQKANKNKESKSKEQHPANNKPVDLDVLKKSELVAKNQTRYVVFVGNIPYDTTPHDLKEHFVPCGNIKHVRIPTSKDTNKPRGFAYVEAVDEDTYQKCLSRHHSQIKGRRINVLYTQGGKKKGEDRKKEIKVKNFKLGALRQQGKLLGSTKDSQKRSFRRKKQKMNEEVQDI